MWPKFVQDKTTDRICCSKKRHDFVENMLVMIFVDWNEMVHESCAGCYSIKLCHVCILLMLLRLHSCVYSLHTWSTWRRPAACEAEQRYAGEILNTLLWSRYAWIIGYVCQERMLESLPLFLWRSLGRLCHYTSPSVLFHLAPDARLPVNDFVLEPERSTLVVSCIFHVSTSR
jgi:hypothetical protein